MPTAVAKLHLSKRWREPGSSARQEATIDNPDVLTELLGSLEPGERVEYYVRSPYAPTYYIREMDEAGEVVDELRVVGGGIIVRDQESFMPRSHSLRKLLDNALAREIARQKRRKLSFLVRIFRRASASP